jgi:hypothetical protein
LVVGLGSLALTKIQGYMAVERDARAARLAVSSGRHKKANEPLERWLHARSGSAEAHALMALVALADGDLGKVTDEMNQARSLGYPHSGLESS